MTGRFWRASRAWAPASISVVLIISSQLALAQSVFTQQGPKLVGTFVSGNIDFAELPGEGFSVALSRDGHTAIVGGRWDGNLTGAAWVFTRSNGVWSQQGSKLVGDPALAGLSEQGFSVALSGDGNTAGTVNLVDPGALALTDRGE